MIAPSAAASARPNAAKPSSEATRNVAATRASAAVESKLARASGVATAPASPISSRSSASCASLTSTSRGASRASIGPSITRGHSVTVRSPVETSTQANAPSPRTSAKAAR